MNTLEQRVNDAERAITILAKAILEMPKPLTHIDDTGVMNNAVMLLAARESTIADAVEYYAHETGGDGNGGHG